MTHILVAVLFFCLGYQVAWRAGSKAVRSDMEEVFKGFVQIREAMRRGGGIV